MQSQIAAACLGSGFNTRQNCPHRYEGNPTKTKTVLIYRDDLLSYSETFIRDQADALRAFGPIFVGIRCVKGLEIQHPKYTLATGNTPGRIKRVRAKFFGPSRRLLHTLSRFSPQLIHAHFLVDSATAAQIAQSLEIPLLVSVHGYDATVGDEYLRAMGIPERVYLKRRQSIIERATRFLCVSQFLRERLIEKGFPSEKVLVHYTGVDTEFFSPDESVRRIPNVLFVGRLVEKKGCELLIRAMAKVQKQFPTASLTVIGDGPLRSQLQRLAASTLSSFQFLGSQPREVVRQWMNVSMVFSVPSITAVCGDAEGFGMVFAEAQSMGLPVVSFASGGIPEAVADGNTGALGMEGDCCGLAKAIEMFLADRNIWSFMSANARMRVRERFDLQKQTSHLERIYTQTSVRSGIKEVDDGNDPR